MTPITPDMIRRFPFAAPGHMITDHDEAFIAAHMRATVTTEQRRRRLTPGASPSSVADAQDAGARSNNATRLARAAQSRQVILDILGSREMATFEITAAMNATGHVRGYDAMASYLRLMLKTGMVTRRMAKYGNGKMSFWRVAA